MSEPERTADDTEHGASIDAAELAAWLRQGKPFTVLDVQNRDEFEQWHVSESTTPDEDGGYVATLGDLRKRIRLLGLDEEPFVDRITESLPPRPANDEAINLGEREEGEETAFELELGPNNCAAE